MFDKFFTQYKSDYNDLTNTKISKDVSRPFVENNFCSCTQEIIENEKRGIFELARAFLSMGEMTNKKLQKLCYYAQAWHLALEDEPLIENCAFEAWVHGPVCPDLYNEYKRFGYERIPQYIGNVKEINEEYMDFAQEVFEAYGELSGNELEKLSHQEYPWKNARGDLKPWEPCNNIILEDDMKSYYRSING